MSLPLFVGSFQSCRDFLHAFELDPYDYQFDYNNDMPISILTFL
jgi:hypothetical protein